MQEIFNLADINFVSLFISICTALVGIKAAVSLFEWVIDKLGLETKWMRAKREDHNLLKQTSESLIALQNQQSIDRKQSIQHDKIIKEELNTFMNEMRTSISKTQDNINQFAENRIHDREQSMKIQKELTNAQNRLSESMENISEKLDEIQEKTDERFKESEQRNNKRIRAELKDKISQSYRYYHSLGKINDMELEALEDLIEEYESVNGKNSFVHSVVQKEMYTWEKVERN